MQNFLSFMRDYSVFLATKKDLFEIILLTYPSRNRSHCEEFS